jgi:hypothetical protein
MRHFFIFFLAAFASATAFSSPLSLSKGSGEAAETAVKTALDRFPEGSVYYEAETIKIEAELAQRKLGDLSLGELKPYRDRLSVAAQKDAFVRDAGAKSFALPGAGQLMMGDTGRGIAFAGTHVALLVGQSVLPFFFLPKDLRRIDYSRGDFEGIVKAWGSHSFNDFGPAIGVSAGFMLGDLALKVWSSLSAKSEARKRIANGELDFLPRISPEFLGFDYRY